MATKKTGSLKGVDVVLITSINLAAEVGGSVLPVANGGTGTGTWTDGQIAIGNTTGNTLTKTTLTGTSNQVVVTNGAGAITLSLPQSIATTSPVTFASLACPTFTTSSGSMTIAPAGVLGIGGTGSSQAVVQIGAAHTLTGTVQVAALASLTGTAAGTTAIRGFQTSVLTTAAAYTCSDIWHHYAAATTVGAGSTVTRIGKFVAHRDSNATSNVGFYYGTALTWTGNYGLYVDSTVDNYFGGNAGFGTASPSARLHAISTTEQLRLGYDASNYYSTTVSSAGSVNFAATGASAAFAFNATVSASGGLITGNIILYSSTVSVPTATNVTINVRANTSTMATGYCYRVRLNTAGTGTVTGAVYIINQTSATPTWVATAVSVAGSTSNHPLLIVSGSNIQVYHNHGSTYLVSYVVETIATNNGTVNAATIWGADSLFTGTDSTSITTASGYALGVGTSPSARLHAVSTTEQLRLGYDTSNYYSTTVSSAGAVTFDAVGASSGFTFSDAVTVSVATPLVTFKPTANNQDCGLKVLDSVGAIAGYLSIVPNTIGTNSKFFMYLGGPAAADIKMTVDDDGVTNIKRDASNYCTITPSSVGLITFDAVGSGAAFSFADNVSVTNTAGDCIVAATGGTPLTTAGDGYLNLASSRTDTGVGHIVKLRSVASSAGKADLAFLTQPSNGVYTERMRIDNAGYVGIGTTAPQTKLQVTASETIASAGVIQIGGGASASYGVLVDYAALNSGRCSITQLNNSGGSAATIALGFGAISAGFPTNNVLTLTQAANVGIGTITPSARLHAISTTEQLRVGYDVSNYYSTTVSSAGAVTFDATGASAGFSFSDNIGIGMTPTYLVDILSPTLTNFGTQWVMRARGPSSCTTNGTNYMLAFDMDVSNMSVSAGVTDSGYRMGVRGDAYSSVAGFAGTLATQYGVYGRAGINVATAGAAVTNAEGLHGEVLNSVAGTTITNGFGLKVVNTGTTGTMTNRWGVYVDTATGGKNYFSHAVGVGSTTISAQIHATSTTEQLRLGYDASNYYSTTVSSAGAVTFNATGASAGFTFADPVTAQSSLTLGVASTTTGSLVLCGSGGANTHTIKAAAIPAATNSYVWPSASPTASQVLTASAPATGVVTLSWASGGAGDVVGPASSTANAASVFSGTTGKLLRASPTVTYYSVAAGVEDKIEFGATFKDFRTATDGATVTFDLDLSDQWQVTFAGNRTLAVSNASIGQRITILRYQDATGNRTPTWWSNITWNNGLAPVDDPTASGWSMTVLACEGLDAYSVPKWKEVCRSTSAPLRGITTATDGATVTFDLRVCQTQRVTLAGNRTLALTSGSFYVGQMFDIKLTQDATGSRTVTWFSAVKWTGGTIPTLTTTAGRSDWFRFICTNASGSPTFDCLGTSMNLVA